MAQSIYPISATFLVVRRSRRRKLQLLREQMSFGKIRAGREICGHGRTSFTRIHPEVFHFRDDVEVLIHVYETSNGVATLKDASLRIIAMGLHHNGEHAVIRNGDVGNPLCLEAKMFSVSDIVVITGYTEKLDGQVLRDPKFGIP